MEEPIKNPFEPGDTKSGVEKLDTGRQRIATATQPTPNSPCHCGSGRKYKKCCYSIDMFGPASGGVNPNATPQKVRQRRPRRVGLLAAAASVALVGGLDVSK